MKRKILSIVAVAAAVVPVAAVATAPPASSAEIIEVCITITEKFVGFSINGTPVGIRVPTLERTCTGV